MELDYIFLLEAANHVGQCLLINALGIKKESGDSDSEIKEAHEITREEVGRMLKNGEITFEEAEKLLGGL